MYYMQNMCEIEDSIIEICDLLVLTKNISEIIKILAFKKHMEKLKKKEWKIIRHVKRIFIQERKENSVDS